MSYLCRDYITRWKTQGSIFRISNGSKRFSSSLKRTRTQTYIQMREETIFGDLALTSSDKVMQYLIF